MVNDKHSMAFLTISQLIFQIFVHFFFVSLILVIFITNSCREKKDKLIAIIDQNPCEKKHAIWSKFILVAVIFIGKKKQNNIFMCKREPFIELIQSREPPEVGIQAKWKQLIRSVSLIYRWCFFQLNQIFWFGCCVSVDSLTIRYEITNCHVHDCSGCYTGTRMNNGDFLFVCSVLLIWCWYNDKICTQNIETKRHRSTVKISAN